MDIHPAGSGADMRSIERVLADQRLAPKVHRLAVAAFGGPEDLERVLAGGEATPLRSASDDGPGVGRAWIRGLRVEGYQGIGPAVKLDFEPGPGLTLFVGRNGAGKSSMAEALEIALTGTSSRWEGKTRAWRDGWRNLHATEPPRIDAEFVIEGSSDTLHVSCVQGASTASTDLMTSRLRLGEQEVSPEELGWPVGLEVYRPFLPYVELGALIGGKSTVAHDALARGLDLGVPTAAAKTLKAAAADRTKAWKAVIDEVPSLITRLEAVNDPRARRILEALTATVPGLDVVRDVLAGVDKTSGHGIAGLHMILDYRPPAPAGVEAAAQRLVEACDAHDRVTRSDAGRDLDMAELLRRAIDVHGRHGEERCPVCGEGRLDAAWLARAEDSERHLRASATEVTASITQLRSARSALEDLIPRHSPDLPDLSAFGLELGGPLQAFQDLTNAHRVEDDRERAAFAIARARIVDEAFARLRDQAREVVEQREDAWRDVVPVLVVWHERARAAAEGFKAVDPLKRAQKAVEAALGVIRAERWKPIESTVRGLWEELRVASNVALDGLEPAGTGAQRRIDLRLSVDGNADAVLGVMSQGEVTALALSLFLPRVTLPDSPFRFVILDDPVQSMDVARVDGLARVLAKLAESRQIIVFTHDSRLHEAILRLQIPATIYQVSRGTDSRVFIRPAMDPATRHLADAKTLCGPSVPVEFARQAVPILGRFAIEARCIQIIRGRIVSAGRLHAEADEVIDGLTRATDLVSYVVFDKAGSDGELYATMNARFGSWAVDTLKACAEGAHGNFQGEPRKLVDDVDHLIKVLK